MTEQLGPGGASRGGADEDCVGGKQRREHDNVAQQEDPEAIGNHDPLGSGAGLAGRSKGLLLHVIDSDSDVHRTTSAW